MRNLGRGERGILALAHGVWRVHWGGGGGLTSLGDRDYDYMAAPSLSPD